MPGSDAEWPEGACWRRARRTGAQAHYGGGVRAMEGHGALSCGCVLQRMEKRDSGTRIAGKRMGVITAAVD
jgi:hypothetical protein